MRLFNSDGERLAVSYPESGCRTLVVEDDPDSRESMMKGLGRFGYEADGAGTFLEGIAKLSSRIHWLVLDLRLPDGEGTALLRYIREHDLPVKVAVVTGDGNGARLAETALLKPDARFMKPVDFGDVANWMASTELWPPGGEDPAGADTPA